MRARILASRSPVGRAPARGQLAHDRADRVRRIGRLARGAHQPRADDHAVGARLAAACSACSGVPIPKPSATGTSVLAFARARISARSAPSARRSPVVPTTETVYRKPRASRADRARGAPAVVVGATSGTSASPCAIAGLEHLRRLAERQVGHDQPATPAARERARRTPPRPGRRPCSRSTSAPPERSRDSARATSSTPATFAPAASARVPAAWITGPSASGSE